MIGSSTRCRHCGTPMLSCVIPADCGCSSRAEHPVKMDSKCLSPQHHRAECECAKGRRCEGCGALHAKCGYVTVMLLNGALYLCQNCLAELNGKNPEVKALRERVKELESDEGFQDQCRHMAEAAAEALGVPFEHVAPIDITNGFAALKEALKPFASVCLPDNWNPDGVLGFDEFPSGSGYWRIMLVGSGGPFPKVADYLRAAKTLKESQ